MDQDPRSDGLEIVDFLSPDSSRNPANEPLRSAVKRTARGPVRHVDLGLAQSDEAPPQAPQLRHRKWLALSLFVATCLSTWFAWSMHFGSNRTLLRLTTAQGLPVLASELTSDLWEGLQYALPLMLILVCHEMGHFLQARRYGVPATLPYFIPMPITQFGTFGAVIIQGSGVADRKSLFDIAISGPLAGLVVALPVAFYGVWTSTYSEIPADYAGYIYSDPLILKWMITLRHGPLPANTEVNLNPMLFAGWVGIFITGLNLIPIGQLDGGHVLYTLIGKRAHQVALTLLFLIVLYMVYTQYPAFLLMVVLLFLMGPRHPPTADDDVPIGRTRIILGWLTLSFVILGLTPHPIIMP